MSNNNSIQFIKPCRNIWEKEHRLLTPEYAKMLVAMGHIVQINLDNCSIQRMERLPDNPTVEDAEKVGLLDLVKILQSAPIALSMMGVVEMPVCKVKEAKLAYERFCASFWPGHNNDTEASNGSNKSKSNEGLEFTELSDNARSCHGIAYVALLQIQHIHMKYSDLAPEKKFETYIYSMTSMLDLISSFELEIAKYAFWDLSSNDINMLPEQIRMRRKDIKENFTAIQNSFFKRKHFALNGAMDLYWLNGSNLSEDSGLTLKTGDTQLVVDNWVGTTDNKLYRIAKDIHSVFYDGSTMKRLFSSREPELLSSQYWQEVDAIAENVLAYRERVGYGIRDQHLTRIDNAIRHIVERIK